jgi:hypothetical protein
MRVLPLPTLLVAVLLALPAPARAQELTPLLPRVRLPVPAETPYPFSASLPDSVKRSRPTHWKQGLVAGAAAGALFGALLGHELCRNSDSAHDGCLATTLGGAAVLAVPTAVLGALIGGAFPRGQLADSSVGPQPR